MGESREHVHRRMAFFGKCSCRCTTGSPVSAAGGRRVAVQGGARVLFSAAAVAGAAAAETFARHQVVVLWRRLWWASR